MAISLTELKEWLDEVAGIEEDPSVLSVAIDEGGLALVILDKNGDDTGETYEVGGIPDEDEMED